MTASGFRPQASDNRARTGRFGVALVMITSLMVFAAARAASNPAKSVEDRLNYIHENGQLEHPDPRPTVLSESEVNAYVASGDVRLPDGVQSLRFAGVPGVITAYCRVDFDRVRAGRSNSNPLLRLFSGVHDVVVEADAEGSNYQGHVHVKSVAIDEIEVPQFVLRLFVEKYVTPRYPGVGIDSKFTLPDKIETASVGSHKLTLIQR